MNYKVRNEAGIDSANDNKRDRLPPPVIAQNDPKAIPTSHKGKDPSKAKNLKEQLSFAKILENDGHKLKHCGKHTTCLCPFHDDHNPSFSIWGNDRGGKCWACGWHGDIFTYAQEFYNLGFIEALERLQRNSGTLSGPSLAARKTSKIAPDYVLTPVQKAEMAAGSILLVESPEIYDAIVAKERGWQPETIKKLALKGSLGWHKGNLAFNYSTGMKLRQWPVKKLWWEYGHPSIWRSNCIAEATTVYISEGEIDAISLIDMGFEKITGTAVIALPSASSIPENLPALLSGKDVVLVMDNDEAGQGATEILCDILLPACKTLSAVNIGEVSHE